MDNYTKIKKLIGSGRSDVVIYKLLEKAGIRKLFTTGFPYSVMIEPTNICNLSCPTCPTGSGKMNRQKYSMNFSEFKHIIDQLRGRTTLVTLFNYGEPFLNKDFIKMIDYASSAGLWVTTSTNGHFFESKEFCNRLVKSGLKDIIVAIDGLDQSTVTKFRHGADFNKIEKGISLLAKEKNYLGSEFPKIELQFILMKQNQHQREGIISLARKLKVDSYSIKCVWINYADPEFQKLAKKYLPDSASNNRYYLNDDGTFSIKGEITNYCSAVNLSTVINSDGNVIPCCYDVYSKFIMGNIFQQSLDTIWNNEKYTSLRKKIGQSRKSISICQGCPECRYIIRKTRKLRFC